MESARLKTAEFAPMTTASVTIAVRAKAGDRRSMRSA